jgi:hypothetical protein
MPIRLDTVLKKIERMSSRVNSDLLKDFYQHMNKCSKNGTFELRNRTPESDRIEKR